jgi:hypothetical protein
VAGCVRRKAFKALYGQFLSVYDVFFSAHGSGKIDFYAILKSGRYNDEFKVLSIHEASIRVSAQ